MFSSSQHLLRCTALNILPTILYIYQPPSKPDSLKSPHPSHFHQRRQQCRKHIPRHPSTFLYARSCQSQTSFTSTITFHTPLSPSLPSSLSLSHTHTHTILILTPHMLIPPAHQLADRLPLYFIPHVRSPFLSPLPSHSPASRSCPPPPRPPPHWAQRRPPAPGTARS